MMYDKTKDTLKNKFNYGTRPHMEAWRAWECRKAIAGQSSSSLLTIPGKSAVYNFQVQGPRSKIHIPSRHPLPRQVTAVSRSYRLIVSPIEANYNSTTAQPKIGPMFIRRVIRAVTPSTFPTLRLHLQPRYLHKWRGPSDREKQD
jgi:hypothetical protein